MIMWRLVEICMIFSKPSSRLFNLGRARLQDSVDERRWRKLMVKMIRKVRGTAPIGRNGLAPGWGAKFEGRII